jgi:transglutaminase-like putative cysteine protease
VRFGLSHKVTSYAMLGCAFLALVGGGGVGAIATLGGTLALIGSWWWEAPRVRVERWTLAWNLASLLALAYVVLSGAATGDFVGAGAEFLIWLAVAKAYNRRAARDWLQLYLLCFLMLVAGSVLNADLAYGVAFLGFVLTSTWALILFHLRREMEDNFLLKHADDRSERVEVQRILGSRRIVGRGFFLGTGAVSLVVFAASATAFLAIPRIGAGMFLSKRGGLTMAGFSDNGVKLGGHGRIKNDSTVVMRVEIAERFGGRRATPIHWRGVSYDQYRFGEWTRSRAAPETKYSLGYRLGHEVRDLAETVAAPAVQQDIWLEPLDSDVLFAASTPARFDIPLPIRPPRRVDAHGGEVRFPHGDKLHYQAWSDLSPPDPAHLRALRDPVPPTLAMYLQLPTEITARTRALAAELTAPYDNTFDKATAIASWLEANLGYTLTLVDPGAQEPVDFFLFDRKQGHCEYFASAFAVLARAAGIATRNVNGFYGGEWNEYDGYVAVRAGDAHSWAEVYFPGHGWVTFDPTPAGEIDRLGRGSSGVLARMGRWLDTLRFQWTKWVIEYDLHQQLALFRGVGRAFKQAGRWVSGAARTAKAWVVDHAVPLAIGAGALVLAAAWWLRRRRGGGAPGWLGGRRGSPTGVVAAHYQRALTALGRRGLARDPALTGRERAQAWRDRRGVAAAELTELTELLYAVEFGGATDPALASRAGALADAIVAAARASQAA